MAALTLAPDGDLAIHPKGLMAVEHYLVVRNLMYRSVYNHRLNVVCNWMLEHLILATAPPISGRIRSGADSVMQRWLWEPDDLDLELPGQRRPVRTGYHLQRWQEEAPPRWPNSADRFLDRRLLKATAVDASQSEEEQLQSLALSPDNWPNKRNGPHPLLRATPSSDPRISPLSRRPEALGWAHAAGAGAGCQHWWPVWPPQRPPPG